MEAVFKSIGTICIISFVTGLLNEFIPSDYTKKAIRLTVAVYIVTMLLIPDNYSFAELEYDIDYAEDYTDETEDYMLEIIENKLVADISDILSAKNISYNNIEVHINKQSEGLIIESICLQGVSEDDRELATQLLSEYADLTFGD